MLIKYNLREREMHINENVMSKLHASEQSWTQIEFEAIFHAYWQRIYLVAFRLTGSPDEAEDLALEVFWRLWNCQPTRLDNVAGWLYRVTTNLGYNALRAARRRRQHEQEAGIRTLETREDNSPDQAAEQAIERERVRQVLASLPARQARLLTLRYSGLRYQEIAEALQISPASVGKLLNRAEKAFCRNYKQGGKNALKQ